MAFSIPSIPTDNLYKFYSLSGLVVFLFSLTFLVIQYDNLIDKIGTLKNETDILKLEKEFLLDDIQSFKNKIAHLENSIAEYSITKDSLKNKSEKHQEFIKNIQNDQQYRDYIEFTYKYEEYIIPEIKEQNEILNISEKIILAQREFLLKESGIESKISETDRKYNELIILTIIFIMLFFLSYKLTKKGFDLWQKKVQNPIDEKLQLEIELLKIDRNEKLKEDK